MYREVIDTLEGFEAIREVWEEIHDRDPAAGVFTSWAWFRGWLDGTPYPWKILALRSGEEYLAFLPLGVRARSRRGVRIHEFCMGGNPSSDHAGFLCRPERSSEVVAGLAAVLEEENWTILRLQDVFDPKVEQLVQALAGWRFEIRRGPDRACPYLALPGTWEAYLAQVPSSQHRRKFARYIREFRHGGEFRVELSTGESFGAHLEVLMRLFRQRWPHLPAVSLELKRQLLGRCFDAGLLLLPVLYYRDHPVAAQAVFVDVKNATLSDYNGGWDPDFPGVAPGNRLKCFLLHHAIGKGYRYFDFLRGNESYKKETFGAELRFNREFTVCRRDRKHYWEVGLDLLQELRPGRRAGHASPSLDAGCSPW